MYKLAFFVPDTHKEKVKQALFDAGAGRIGNYDCCSWEVEGQGQFRALPGANPYIGTLERIETVREFKVEMVCDDVQIVAVLQALRAVHPYEEPAFDVWKLAEIDF